MPPSVRIEQLPAFVVLEALPVLNGVKQGASIQLDRSYFKSMQRVLATMVEDNAAEKRIQGLERSQKLCENVTVDVDAFEESTLEEASDRLQATIRRMPEVVFLRATYPGELRAVPEWLRIDDELNYGIRVYYFQQGDAPARSEIVQHNIESVANDTQREFDEYVGQLHGYPRCCIDHYGERTESAPEQRSVEPFSSAVRTAKLHDAPNTSIEDILPDFFDSNYAYSFFAREFFPESECDTARHRGENVYDTLSRTVDDQLTRDYFRLNYLFDYAVTRFLERDVSRRPFAGELGKEHLYFYLPLDLASTHSKYGSTGTVPST